MGTSPEYSTSFESSSEEACFRGKLKNPADITVLKIKRYRTGLTQGYN